MRQIIKPIVYYEHCLVPLLLVVYFIKSCFWRRCSIPSTKFRGEDITSPFSKIMSLESPSLGYQPMRARTVSVPRPAVRFNSSLY
jgi:hypothetical protein